MASTDTPVDDLQDVKNNSPPKSESSFFNFCCADARSDKKDNTKKMTEAPSNVIIQEKGTTAALPIDPNDDAETQNAKAIFALLDEDGSGSIEKGEFKDRLRDNEELACVFFKNSGFEKPRGGEWADLAVGKNSKKVFASIDTTASDSRSKRVLTINEIIGWCRKTGASL